MPTGYLQKDFRSRCDFFHNCSSQCNICHQTLQLFEKHGKWGKTELQHELWCTFSLFKFGIFYILETTLRVIIFCRQWFTKDNCTVIGSTIKAMCDFPRKDIWRLKHSIYGTTHYLSPIGGMWIEFILGCCDQI